MTPLTVGQAFCELYPNPNPNPSQAFCELYPLRECLSQKDSHYLCYALTHVIYALNNFGERSLPASLFPAPVSSHE